MDLVYVIRDGPNEELRYSLRSVAANLPHRRVWVIGGAPPRWLVGAEQIPMRQSGTKYQNTTASVLTACQHPEISDPWVLMNDDFFVLRPILELPVYYRGTVADVLAEYERRRIASGYTDGARKTAALLMQLGFPHPLSYELHVPMPIQKRPMVEALRIGLEAGVHPLHKRTLYGNLARVGGVQMSEDPKVHRVAASVVQWERMPFLSTLDVSFQRGAVGVWLRGRFPDPSPYELSVV